MARYIRVLPRDLFNEGSLLTCLGKLVIRTENMGCELHDDAAFNSAGFDIAQNQDDGSIFVRNLRFTVHGVTVYLFRPLNSRNHWPLWIEPPGGAEDIRVFEDTPAGVLSNDMLRFIAECRDKKQ